MKKIVSFAEEKGIEKIKIQNLSYFIKSKIEKKEFYIIYAENFENLEIYIESFQEYLDNYLCEYNIKLQFSDIQWGILEVLWEEDIFESSFFEKFWKKIEKVTKSEFLEESKKEIEEEMKFLLNLSNSLSPSIFLGIDKDLKIKLKKFFLLSLRLLQKYFLEKKDIKTLISIRKGFLKINVKLETSNLKDRIYYQVLCIEEKLFLYNKSKYSLSDLRKEFTNFFLDKKNLNKVSLSHFISTPLRTEIYYNILLISKISNFVDILFRNKKEFYIDFFGKETNYEVMGSGMLNGSRKITLSNIKKFIEKYSNKMDDFIHHDINHLYFYYFKHNEIYSLISSKYDKNSILNYEKGILYKNDVMDIKINNDKESLNNLLKKEMEIKYSIPFLPDALDNNTRILLGTLDKEIKIGKTYVARINIDNLNDNLKVFKGEYLKFSDSIKKYLKEATFIERYITFTPLLLEKINLENPYPLVYIKFLEKKQIENLEEKNNCKKIYLCEFRMKLQTGKYHYVELFILEDDIEVIGLVNEIKTVFNR